MKYSSLFFKKKICLITALLFASIAITAQEYSLMSKRMFDYISSYPQEKVYAFTDKGSYVSGETVWYRLFLTDATMHWEIAEWSRYIYVDLIDPNGKVIVHDKIVQDEYGIFHNSLDLADDLPEGYYQFKAYTGYMLGTPDYLFEKRIFVSDPQSSVLRIEPVYTPGSVRLLFYANDKITSEVTRFRTISHLGNKEEHSSGESIMFSRYSSQKNLCVEFEYRNRLYRKYIPFSEDAEEYDVSFYAEGGNLLDGVENRIGIKALKQNGLSCEIRGKVYDDLEREITDISTIHAGMGSFVFTPEQGRSYYAICTDGRSVTRRFDLPSISEGAYSLHARWEGDELYVSVRKGSRTADVDGLLFAHVRGTPVYSDKISGMVRLNKNSIPSGVIQLLLLDNNLNPLSERLCFHVNEYDTPLLKASPDRDSYGRRELVKVALELSDIDGFRQDGRVAISVTDNKDVSPDSTVSILSHLLLSSELKGHIEMPEYYLGSSKESREALDALMLTQGWRRYDVAKILSGNEISPGSVMEQGESVSGIVIDKNTGNPLPGVDISIFSLVSGIADTMVSDSFGRFYFGGFDLSDGSSVVVNIYDPGAKYNHAKLIIDEVKAVEAEAEPFTLNDHVPSANYEEYIIKSDRKYTEEYGMRVVNLDAVTVVGTKRDMRTIYSTGFNRVISTDRIREARGNAHSILSEISGVYVQNGTVFLTNVSYNRRGMYLPARVVVDGIIMPVNFNVETELRGREVVSLEIIPSGASMVLDVSFDELKEIATIDPDFLPDVPRINGQPNFTKNSFIVRSDGTEKMGMRGMSGAVIITTEAIDVYSPRRNPDKYVSLYPKGYKAATEFYSPRYETSEEKMSKKTDLRTTIYWNPDLVIKDGKGTFDFYSSDAESTYSITVEGISSEGGVVRFSDNLITIRR